MGMSLATNETATKVKYSYHFLIVGGVCVLCSLACFISSPAWEFYAGSILTLDPSEIHPSFESPSKRQIRHMH